MNDLVTRAFTSASILSSKEPHGLVRLDGKRPEGLTLVPWKRSKPLAWDVRPVCTMADSYVARVAGAAAERAAELKIARYSRLGDKCIFQPIAVESFCPLNETACQFLRATRSIERISYGNVAGWLGGCLSQPVLYQND